MAVHGTGSKADAVGARVYLEARLAAGARAGAAGDADGVGRGQPGGDQGWLAGPHYYLGDRSHASGTFLLILC